MGLVYKSVCSTIDLYLWFKGIVIHNFLLIAKTIISTVYDDHELTLNGPEPWHPQVKDDIFYERVAVLPILGLVESYMDGHCDIKDLEQFAYLASVSGLFAYPMKLLDSQIITFLKLHAFEAEDRQACCKLTIDLHGNPGHDFFANLLSETMTFSSAIWTVGSTLDEAQYANFKLIGQKLKLKPGMKVMDIGCGWGTLCKYLAEKHNVSLVGYTTLAHQAEYAKQFCKGFNVEIRCGDFREARGETFDRILSVEFFEHLGVHDFRTFFSVARKCLKERNGLLLVQTKGCNHLNFPRDDIYVDKYLFPNTVLPLPSDISTNSEGFFIIEDWDNLSKHYPKTLQAWTANLENLRNKLDRKTFRLWSFYLRTMSGIFRARKLQCWQIVFSPSGLSGGYDSLRM